MLKSFVKMRFCWYKTWVFGWFWS